MYKLKVNTFIKRIRQIAANHKISVKLPLKNWEFDKDTIGVLKIALDANALALTLTDDAAFDVVFVKVFKDDFISGTCDCSNETEIEQHCDIFGFIASGDRLYAIDPENLKESFGVDAETGEAITLPQSYNFAHARAVFNQYTKRK